MDKLDANAILNMEIEHKLHERVREIIMTDTVLTEHLIQGVRSRMLNDRNFAIGLQKTMASIIQSSALY